MPEIKILGDGCVLFCQWCKAAKSYIPQDCKACFESTTISSKQLIGVSHVQLD